MRKELVDRLADILSMMSLKYGQTMAGLNLAILAFASKSFAARRLALVATTQYDPPRPLRAYLKAGRRGSTNGLVVGIHFEVGK